MDLETNRTIDHLFPSNLTATPSGITRIAVLGSCMAHDVSVNQFRKLCPNLKVDFLHYNNPSDVVFADETLSLLDFQYVQMPLRHIFGDVVIRPNTVLEWERVKENALRRLDLMFDGAVKYTRTLGIPTIVASFIVPQMPIVSCLKDIGTDRDLSVLTQKLNLHLAERVAVENDCYFLNIDAVAAALGKAYILDEWFHLFTHNTTFSDHYFEDENPPYFLNQALPRIKDFRPSIEDAFHKAVWRQIESMYRAIRQLDQVKLVIFDLDNTISRGLIAEHYTDPDARPISFGWPEGVAETIHHLRARGILVALCSKNDEGIVKKFWSDALDHGLLELDDFVVRKISWQPKAEAVAEIISELNLSARSVVFVDDNQIEREAVKAAFPEIRVTGENPYLTKATLLWAPECQVPLLTRESVQREKMTRGQLEREVSRISLSRDAFLKSLECEVDVFDVVRGHHRFARCLELINKTNQFNTTGRRWTSHELNSFLDQGGIIVAFNVKDRFTEYGLVGALLYLDGTIVQYVMSCRVLGIGVEEAVLNAVLGRFAANVSSFRGEANDTELNTASRSIFDRCVFERGSDGVFFRSKRAPISLSEHILLRLHQTDG